MFLKCCRTADPIVVFNSQDLLLSFENDKEFVKELVLKFIPLSEELADSIECNTKSRDYLAVSTAAHTLHGTSANLGCDPLRVASHDLELYTKCSEIVDKEVKVKVNLVLYEINRAIASINVYLQA